MKRIFIICLMSIIPLTANSQTCNPNIQLTNPDNRYEIISNGLEVKDNNTGLIWQRCSIGQDWNGFKCSGQPTRHPWRTASRMAEELGSGYRLPTLDELQSLTEKSCYNPSINTTLFPNTLSKRYWTATPNTDPRYDTDRWQSVWAVGFQYGSDFVESSAPEFGKNYVRGVR